MAEANTNIITALIGFGGNLNNTYKLFKKSIALLNSKEIRVVRTSSIYQTEAWGYTSENDYLNAVIEINCCLCPKDLLAHLQGIELDLGRIRGGGTTYSDRTIDLDILFYGEQVINSTELQIPHPRLTERKFVLVPLNEIEPDFYHPEFGLSVAELLAKCKDLSTPIKRFNPLDVNT